MADHSTLDIASFRLAYPAFADDVKYSDTLINQYYATAGTFIPMNDVWCGLNGAALDNALQLLTAHLLWLYTLAMRGQTGKIMTASSIDKISISVLAPPVRGAWDWWLMQTPYGQALLALLSGLSVGGWSVGGAPERAGFRRVGGRFL